MVFCPICRGATDRSFKKHGYWIRECSACRHRFAEIEDSGDHVPQVYNDAYFRLGGAGYPDYLREAWLLEAHGRRYARLLGCYTQPGTILDVGAAAGFILKGFEECGWRGLGIEPNATMGDYARRQLGLNVWTGKLEDFQSEEQYDLVSMIQVVAHFVEPRRALQVAADLTRPGGYWLIETWDRESAVARVLGSAWHEYSPPSVLHWFSRKGLNDLIGSYGFVAVANGRPRKMVSTAHMKSLLLYMTKNGAFAKLASFLARNLPDHGAIYYPAGDIFWQVCQKTSGLGGVC